MNTNYQKEMRNNMNVKIDDLYIDLCWLTIQRNILTKENPNLKGEALKKELGKIIKNELEKYNK